MGNRVKDSALGITAKSKVIKTVYDALAEKYVSITLGTAKSNFVNTVGDIKTELSEVKNKTEHFPLLINTAVKNATSLITGQNGGYVVINTNSVSGQPYELLILDAPNISDAVNVWRWNVGGLGFSKNGYNGPYETAITSDGQIVADFITSGTLTANIIKAGVISSFDNSSWWDLESGEVHLKAYATNDSVNQLKGTVSAVTKKTAELQVNTERIKELGIAVYFEREKINSLAEDGELMLTLLASFAQEESRSISENIKWATRKRFEKGIPNGHKSPYGYEWDGEMFRIIPEQGEVVKEIYRRYLAGESAYIIAKALAERGVTGQMGKPIEQTTVKEILSSRSYTGTMVLQKNYMTEGHIRKRNKGELPMYLVDDMFEPLVSEEDYQRALEIRQRRAELFPNNQNNLTAFSGKVKCGYCGLGISRRTSGSRKRWVCNTRERKGMESCECRPIWEDKLEILLKSAMKDTDGMECIVI